jgi:hypothetical protein
MPEPPRAVRLDAQHNQLRPVVACSVDWCREMARHASGSAVDAVTPSDSDCDAVRDGAAAVAVSVQGAVAADAVASGHLAAIPRGMPAI